MDDIQALEAIDAGKFPATARLSFQLSEDAFKSEGIRPSMVDGMQDCHPIGAAALAPQAAQMSLRAVQPARWQHSTDAVGCAPVAPVPWIA